MSFPSPFPVSARYQEREYECVRCNLCPHRCLLKEGQRGLCGVREVQSGNLVSLVYGDPISGVADPIEKKPLFHFLPGAMAFSYATVGCNLHCVFCQNHSISQQQSRIGSSIRVSPAQLVGAAKESSSRIIAHTYTEPTIYFEYAYDVAQLADELGIRNVFVTNGYIQPRPVRDIAPYLQAANVDLKAFSEHSYRAALGGRLKPVLDTITLLKELGIWVEVTTLVIPGFNDSEPELRDIARFLAGLDPAIPWHVSRFHPDFQLLDRGRTPPETISRACEIGQEEGLKYVYAGNLRGSEREHTYCPACGQTVIARHGFRVDLNHLESGHCGHCGHLLNGIWV
jgi:pyruvate formate lyase activating enzyme